MLVPGATVEDAGYDANWEKIVAMGWPGLIIDEEHGGLGLSCIDLAMILGEMGRVSGAEPVPRHPARDWAIRTRRLGGAEEARCCRASPPAELKLALAIAEFERCDRRAMPRMRRARATGLRA